MKNLLNLACSVVWKDSNSGLGIRLVLISLIMMFSFALAYGIHHWFAFDFGRRQLAIVFLIIFASIVFSAVFAEIPRGTDWIMARLGLATFCRTGLPIFFWGVITLGSQTQLSTAALGFMVFFYMIGIKASVWISVCRFANSEDALEKNEEVDRAPE